MNIRQLKKLVNETVRAEQRKTRSSNRRKNSRNWNRLVEATTRKVLLQEGAAGSWDKSTDINGKGDALVDAMENDADTLLAVISSATHWAKKALKGNGITDGASLQAKAKEIWGDDLGELKTRVTDLTTKLGEAGGFAKPEMPALEWSDRNHVQDALDSTVGSLGVDFKEKYQDDEPNFKDYVEDQEEEKNSGDGEAGDSGDVNESVDLRRWSKLAGLLTEISNDERFPFPGKHTTFDGASPVVGADGSKDEGKPVALPADLGNVEDGSPADLFLKKGRGTGDQIKMDLKGKCKVEAMIPTQSNVLLAKSMLFALVQNAEENPEKREMEAYLADIDGGKYILDGHHRWSGQFLRGNKGIEMTKLAVIPKPEGMDLKIFLTMLTVMGTALGRPTKK